MSAHNSLSIQYPQGGEVVDGELSIGGEGGHRSEREVKDQRGQEHLQTDTENTMPSPCPSQQTLSDKRLLWS